MSYKFFSTRAFSTASMAVLATGLTFVSPTANAQTVTVDIAGTANGTTIFADLQSAVDSFAVGGVNHGNPAPNVINLRNDRGPIIGQNARVDSQNATTPITMDEDLTIQGADAAGNPANVIFAPTALPAPHIRNVSFPAIEWRQVPTLNLRNIIFMPALADEGTKIRSFLVTSGPNPNDDTGINIDDCVFTSNDGTNNPVTVTGRPEDDDKVNLPAVVGLAAGDAVMWVFSNNAAKNTVNVKNTVFASLSPLLNGASRFEVVKTWMSGTVKNIISTEVNFLEGCVFANLDGNVAQVSWGGSCHINGTAENPVIVRNLKHTAAPAVMWLYYAPGTDEPVAGSINHARFHDIVIGVLSEGGVAGDGSRAWANHVTNSRFSQTGDALILRAGTQLDDSGVATPEVTVANSIFHDVGFGTQPAAIYGHASSARPVNITGSVFTNNWSKYGLYNASTSSVWEVSNSVLSLQGFTPLGWQTGGDGTINLDTTVSDEEIVYENTDNPFEDNFLQPVGWSSVTDWSVY